MDAQPLSLPTHKSRLGFHYYPDTLHYRDTDLSTWLPELQTLGVSWLVLESATDRAIPETFLSGLVQAGIEPIIHFHLSLSEPPAIADIQTLLEAYARWGVRMVSFFDRPNARSYWPASGWAQQDLVERFLDRYLPFANLAVKNSLIPLFPALEPGGNYWDTAFLRAALQSMDRRKQSAVLQNLVLSAYAWTENRSLNWGAGGPETWPETRPYLTPSNSEDQRGFRIYDWYSTISMAVLRKPLPLILFGAGVPADPCSKPARCFSPEQQRDTALSIARLMAGEPVSEPGSGTLLEPVPPYVLACNFWLLTAAPNSPFQEQAWFPSSGTPVTAVQAIQDWTALPFQTPIRKSFPEAVSDEYLQHPIQHYLLLPTYEAGVSDWHLDIIRPFVKRHVPTIGFSIEEASMAARVTVVGNPQTFSDEDLEKLRRLGCFVERISGDGTTIATILAER
jgi:hypothetical protein